MSTQHQTFYYFSTFYVSTRSMAKVNEFLLVCLTLSGLRISLAATFDVTQYDAKGDGETDDTQAFAKAWEATCGAGEESSILNIPSGKTFLLNPLVFMGPCKPSAIQVQIDGTLIAPSSKEAWKNCASNTWIVFESVNSLKIDGTGTLDGKGSSWWTTTTVTGYHDKDEIVPNGEGECDRPTTFRLVSCDSAEITGVHFVNSGGNHISIYNCKNLNINQIDIKAPEDSPNTDGINLFDSNTVDITNSVIGTGDDCIAISNNCFNINISDITCGPGHGISVGSLGKDGTSVAVEGIYIQHCTFTGTQASARIKTWPSGSGYARNIHYDHLTLDSVKSAIEINQQYSDRFQNQESTIEISDIHFTNVQGTASKIVVDCSSNQPCKEIYLQQVNITASSGNQVDVTCENANVEESAVTPQLPCLK